MVPGPSAVTAALALSGFFAQKFVFLGFLPRTAAHRLRELAPYRDSTTTLVYFESPHRLPKSLQAAHEALGDRRAVVCRELTKLHQEAIRGALRDLAEAHLEAKGEVTVVIEGRRRGN